MNSQRIIVHYEGCAVEDAFAFAISAKMKIGTEVDFLRKRNRERVKGYIDLNRNGDAIIIGYFVESF